ncbi:MULTISPECIES: acyl carrier protein [unclassified Nocardiopsis]|uniref:acyl carrier protein n=1 Tax=Nocardiopsis TaxID=2013 RepID=UPI00387AC797
MQEFQFTDLVRLLRECAGQDESVDLDGDIGNDPFDRLGYDSLALFNTVSRIERVYKVSIPEGTIDETSTPLELLRTVNERLQQPA